jgi:hypothetical protein
MAVGVWANTAVDSKGVPVASRAVTVYTDQAGTVLAPVFSDATGSVPLAGSVVMSDGQGNLEVFAAPGTYWGRVVGQSFTFPVVVGEVAGQDAAITSSVTTEASARAAGDSAEATARNAAIAAQHTTDSATFVPLTGAHVSDGTVTTILKQSTDIAGRGPALLTISDGLFNTARDQTLYLGHNLQSDGTLLIAGQPGMAYGQENYYNDGTSSIKMEAYQQFTSTDGTKYFRPWFAQFDRTLNKQTSVSFIAGTQFTFSIDAAGGGVGTETPILSFSTNLLSIPAADPTNNNLLRVRAAATKAATLTLGSMGVDDTFQMTTDTTRTDHVTLGLAGTGNANGPVMHLWNSGSVPSVSIGVSDNASRLTVQGVGNGQAVIVARAGSGGFGDLFQAQQFTSSTPLWTINGAGLPKWNAAANQGVGAGSAALGANCPATTATAPYTWLKALASDGSTVYLPAWK